MPNFLVESYSVASRGAVERARDHASSLTDGRAGVRYLRTIFLPGDETVFHVFEAPSLGEMHRAARRARLECERIVEAVESR